MYVLLVGYDRLSDRIAWHRSRAFLYPIPGNTCYTFPLLPPMSQNSMRHFRTPFGSEADNEKAPNQPHLSKYEPL